MGKREIIILALVSVLLGFLIVKQFYLTQSTEKLKKEEENALIAVEFSRLLKANADLRTEIDELTTSLEKYQKSLSERKSASEEIRKNIEKYKIIAGESKVIGEGVEIEILGDLTKEQLIDLINALKNIGIEAISINGKRLIISSFIKSTSDGLYFEDKKLEKPYRIQAIGNSSLLKESLERKGGIIQQIKEMDPAIEIKITPQKEIILEPH